MRLVYVGAHCFEPCSALHVKGLSARDGGQPYCGLQICLFQEERALVGQDSLLLLAHTHTHAQTHKRKAPAVSSTSLTVVVFLKGCIISRN